MGTFVDYVIWVSEIAGKIAKQEPKIILQKPPKKTPTRLNLRTSPNKSDIRGNFKQFSTSFKFSGFFLENKLQVAHERSSQWMDKNCLPLISFVYPKYMFFYDNRHKKA